MATRVYRLDVTYPDGSDIEGWAPPGWRPITHTGHDADTGAPYDYTPPFVWPRTRLYLSRNGAEKRAALMRSYGATVRVVASEPVTFPQDRPG